MNANPTCGSLRMQFCTYHTTAKHWSNSRIGTTPDPSSLLWRDWPTRLDLKTWILPHMQDHRLQGGQILTHGFASLVPSPHPWGGKGSGNFGQKAWSSWQPTEKLICMSQSDCSFSPIIWLTSHRNVTGPLTAIQIWITYTALLTNHIRALFKHILLGACPEPAKPRKSPKVTRPFSLLLRVGVLPC